MKRLFLILCLITICNISYADIASVGYVDSVVATKQDTITDIETIRTGAGLGATAVQPSSLSTVATSGSYNDLSNKPTTISSFTNDSGYITTSYHDSTKQDKLPNGPSDGIYKLVWNSNLKQFIFQKESDVLTCSSGTYDIGFSQCIDPTIAGTTYTHDAGAMTWKTVFPYGNVSGVAVCNDTSGSFAVSSTTEQVETGGKMCWCKMTHPAASNWVFGAAYSSSSDCAGDCANNCGGSIRGHSAFRSGVFSSVGN
ncbi:MAG: hypothetical protein MJ170_04805 [Alphaproteobacteria bacterium]|nr:hypothetical protein [Alphaproteobacteria bacterium]